MILKTQNFEIESLLTIFQNNPQLTIDLEVDHQGLLGESLEGADVLARVPGLHLLDHQRPVGGVLDHDGVSRVPGEGRVVQGEQVHGGAALVHGPGDGGGLLTAFA